MTTAAPFGRVLTAMVTAVPRRRLGRPRAAPPGSPRTWSTTATTASWSPARPASRRPPPSPRTARSCARSWTRSATGPRVVAGVGTNDTAHSRRAGPAGREDRRRRAAARHAVLQQARPGRRPRTTSAPVADATDAAGDALRRPGPHRHHDRAGDLRGRARECETVVAVKDAVGDFAARRPAHASSATPSTPATTPPTSAGSRTARVGVVSVVGHVAGDQLARDGRRVRSPATTPSALEIFTAAAARDRRDHGRRQLRRHHRQGRPRSCSACSTTGTCARPLVPLDDDEVAALRAGLVGAGLI